MHAHIPARSPPFPFPPPSVATSTGSAAAAAAAAAATAAAEVPVVVVSVMVLVANCCRMMLGVRRLGWLSCTRAFCWSQKTLPAYGLVRKECLVC